MDWLVEAKQQTSADYQLCVASFHYDGGGGCPVLAVLTISVKACDDVCAGLARALWEAVARCAHCCCPGHLGERGLFLWKKSCPHEVQKLKKTRWEH